jgi:phosphoglucomutase
MMREFRENPPKTLDGSPVVRIDDYQQSVSRDPRKGTTRTIALPQSNVLIYTTEEGLRLAARPSGTEPKIKFYLSAHQPIETREGYPLALQELESKLDRVVEELNLNG